MFYYAAALNQPLGTWNMSAVTDMFFSATSFNQSLNTWNVSVVII